MRSVVLMAALVMATPAAAQTVQSGVLVGACSPCHGADLKGSGRIPPLGGYDADDIKKALAEFRTGRRPATVMTRLMKGFSDAEIDAVAEQIGAMK